MGRMESLLVQDDALLAGVKVSGGLPLPLCHKRFDLLDLLHNCNLRWPAAALHAGACAGAPF